MFRLADQLGLMLVLKMKKKDAGRQAEQAMSLPHALPFDLRGDPSMLT